MYAINNISEVEKESLLEMNQEEFDKYMMSHFPDLFRDRHLPPSESPMYFGFSIGRGWHGVLVSLCKNLVTLEKASGIEVVFKQIKEKFGSARFYYDLNCPEGMHNEDHETWANIIGLTINQAEESTFHICEELGTYIYEPISCVGWIYGMSMEGYERHMNNNFSSEVAEKRIEFTKERTNKVKRATQVKNRLVDLEMNYLEAVEKIIDEMTEESRVNNPDKDNYYREEDTNT